VVGEAVTFDHRGRATPDEPAFGQAEPSWRGSLRHVLIIACALAFVHTLPGTEENVLPQRPAGWSMNPSTTVVAQGGTPDKSAVSDDEASPAARVVREALRR
jgi:hypothetical protein